MDVTITPGSLSGRIPAIPSKSEAHRMLVLAAFAQGQTTVRCASSSRDIEATARCLRGLGARIAREDGTYLVRPVPRAEDGLPIVRCGQYLDCGESGSTLRFLLPVVAALDCDARLDGRGRLADRPLSPLREQLEEHGAHLSEAGSLPLEVEGKISGGVFRLPGDVSSQYASGLLMAAAVTDLGVEVRVAEPVQSKPYIDITTGSLARFGVGVKRYHRVGHHGPETVWVVGPEQVPESPGDVAVPGDWSNSALWLCAGALAGDGITVTGLDFSSPQGDRAILAILAHMGARVVRGDGSASVGPGSLVGCDVDVSDVPDLVPPVALVAACASGTTRIRGAARLRLKESDRIATVAAALRALGARVDELEDGLDIQGTGSLAGGVVDAANDHRIAMMAGIASARCTSPVTICGAECVDKSYPTFFDDLVLLGGSFTRGA